MQGPTEKSHHVVFLDEIVLPLRGVDLIDVLLVAGQGTLLFDPDAGGEVVGVRESAGQIADFRLELVDRGGFGGWGGGVVWFSALGWGLGGALRGWAWRQGGIMMGPLGAHVCGCFCKVGFWWIEVWGS